MFFFLKVLFGGIALGFIMGKICSAWLAKVFNDAVVETIITIAFPYITYFIGKFLYTLTSSIALGRGRGAKSREEQERERWE